MNLPKIKLMISFPGMLTILFIALKLTGQIDWSWIWVLSPIWIGPAAMLCLFLLFFSIPFILAMVVRNRVAEQTQSEKEIIDVTPKNQ